MIDKSKKNTEIYTPLARFFAAIEEKTINKRMFFWDIGIICIGLVLFDFFWGKFHGHFKMEEETGFNAMFGFLAFSVVVLGATLLRSFIKRGEDYYGVKAVDAEDYPEQDTEKVDHHV